MSSLLFCPHCSNLLAFSSDQRAFSCTTCTYEFRILEKMETRVAGEKKKQAVIHGEGNSGQLDSTGTHFRAFPCSWAVTAAITFD